MAFVRALLKDLSDHWWVILLRGIAGVIFAVLAFGWPGATLLALVYVWGAYAIIDGAFALYLTYLADRQQLRWWPYLLEGLVGIGAGIVAFVRPGMTELALLFLIAAWAIVTGVAEMIAAVDLRKQIDDVWLLGLSGAFSIIFGVLVALQPNAGEVAIVWTIGVYALVFGVTLIALAFRVRSLGQQLEASAVA